MASTPAHTALFSEHGRSDSVDSGVVTNGEPPKHRSSVTWADQLEITVEGKQHWCQGSSNSNLNSPVEAQNDLLNPSGFSWADEPTPSCIKPSGFSWADEPTPSVVYSPAVEGEKGTGEPAISYRRFSEVGQPLAEVCTDSAVHFTFDRTQDIDPSRGRQAETVDLKIRTDEYFEECYGKVALLGQGAFGTVWSCRHVGTGVGGYAAKEVARVDGWVEADVLKEVELLARLRGCEQIVSYVECFKDDDRFVIITEEVRGGELFDHLERCQMFTECEASNVIRDIGLALKYSHDRGIAHRDLKPENVLCVHRDRASPCKVADFGLSAYSPAATTPALKTPVGTLQYMAPEVVEVEHGQGESYTKKCDIYALGVIAYMLLCGYPPFEADCGQNCGWAQGRHCSECMEDLTFMIKESEVTFPWRLWEDVSESAIDLIRSMLRKNPNERPSIDEVLAHPWVMSAPPTVLPSPGVFQQRLATSTHPSPLPPAPLLAPPMAPGLPAPQCNTKQANTACMSRDSYSSQSPGTPAYLPPSISVDLPLLSHRPSNMPMDILSPAQRRRRTLSEESLCGSLSSLTDSNAVLPTLLARRWLKKAAPQLTYSMDDLTALVGAL